MTLPTEKLNELSNRFSYHKPIDGQPERYAKIRAGIYELAVKICELTPESREQSLALTHLDEAMMFANAAIARNEHEPTGFVQLGSGE